MPDMMTTFSDAFPPTNDPLPGGMSSSPQWEDSQLLTLFDKLKRESMDMRWVWEREWQRDLYYIASRQWIVYHPTRRDWVDKRLQKWVPRPVTNKMAETLQSIRTNLGAINLSVKARPVGDDAQSIAAAEIADQMSPLIHEEHAMNQVMREADFWLIATGNACLQASWDMDERANRLFIQNEQCAACSQTYTPQQVVKADNMCQACGAKQFIPATNDGTPDGQYISFGKGKTTALSPFEYAFPPNATRFDDIPYIIRMRWRDKHWYEANMPELVPKITWEKTPSDRSLQLFKTLAVSNDIGTSNQFASFGSSGGGTTEGVTEYELWYKPTPEFPDGLVLRVIGDKSPILMKNQKEGLPGPFPYKDIEGTPIFPFVHAQYEHMGGRLWGRSAISPLIQKQDQLNQLDSLVQMIIQTSANPAWVVPEGAGVEQLSGQPGLIIKWNPLAANGQAKPERIPGQEVSGSLMALREQIIRDIEELSGAFDIIKGQKPSGVEAFSALQLLVERSQSRFTSVFQARGEMYRHWFAVAIELERSFGPQQRTHAVIGPNRGYTFHHFEHAQLQGQLMFQIEDGSNMPKTALGKRAAIEQANQLRLIDPADPDQRYALLTVFGLSDLSPTLNHHVQAAQQVQDSFERWVQQPQGPPPLVMKPWFDAQIHWVERIKWLNTDKMREMMMTNPQIEIIITQHLQELQMWMMPPPVDSNTGQFVQQSANAPGGGQGMTNSNRESGAIDTLPKGNKQFGPSQGPR